MSFLPECLSKILSAYSDSQCSRERVGVVKIPIGVTILIDVTIYISILS